MTMPSEEVMLEIIPGFDVVETVLNAADTVLMHVRGQWLKFVRTDRKSPGGKAIYELEGK